MTPRTQEQVAQELASERERLAASLDQLRGSVGEATNVAAKLKAKLPVAAGLAASSGFVVAGGIGATLRYFARRGRERNR